MQWSDPKQLLILKWLTAHLEEIEGIDVQSRDDQGNPIFDANGNPVLEQTSLAGRVYRGRIIFGDEEYNPFLTILEGKKPDDAPIEVGSDRLQREENWHLLIQGFMQDDDLNPLDNLYRLKAMVEQHLSLIVADNPRTGDPLVPEKYRMGGLIMDATIGPGLVRPVDAVAGGTETFFLPISLTFDMNVGDPYSVT